MTALTKIEKFQAPTSHFNPDQIELIKNSICKGASHEELQFFLMACQRSGLDPFAKQIYSVPRGNQRTIQTSIDGFRLIADRTGKYAPGREPTFSYDKNGNLEAATSYVMKQTRDGTWHEVSANAHFNEYNAGSPLWKKMPRCMLSKCAESLALRKAFPAEMSGIYGQEEMDQADNHQHSKQPDVKPLYIGGPEFFELSELKNGCSADAQKGFSEYLRKAFGIETLAHLQIKDYQGIKDKLVTRYKEHQKELLDKEMAMKGDDVEVLE